MPEDIYDAFVRAVVAHGYVRKDKSSRRFKPPGADALWLPKNRLAIMLALDDVLDDDNFMLSHQIFEKMNNAFHYSRNVHAYEVMRAIFVPRGEFAQLFEERGIRVMPLLEVLQNIFPTKHIDEINFRGYSERGGRENIHVAYKSSDGAPNNAVVSYFGKRIISVKTVARVNLKLR